MKNKKSSDTNKEEFDRKKRDELEERRDSNNDPISGEPGSHPVGVAAGGTGGAVAGAAVGGAIGGPIGAAIGGVVGAVAGGAAGKMAAEAVNPTEEDRYWRENYRNRPYYREGQDYSEFHPAYKYGWESATRPEFSNRRFEDIESNLESEWPSYRGESKHEWSQARQATRDAYDRIRSRFEDDQYWRQNYQSRPYFRKDYDYDRFQPAFRYGWESASRPEYSQRNFEDVESNLQQDWPNRRGTLALEWIEVRDATRDAFNRARNRTSQSFQQTERGHEQLGRPSAEISRDTGDRTGFWDQVKGNWKQFKGSIKEKWNDLTDDEIEQMEGRKERIVGKIQEKYGESKWKEADIERELRNSTER